MLSRRHIRIKAMQSVYAFTKSKNSDLEKELKYLYSSLTKLYELYILQLNLLVELQKLTKKKYEISKSNRITKIDSTQSHENLINNKVLLKILDSKSLSEYSIDKKLANWSDNIEFVQLIWQEVINSDIFKEYGEIKNPNFAQDKDFVLSIYKKIIAPNNKLYDFFESENIGWIDDLPFINTLILKEVAKIHIDKNLVLCNLYKNNEDRDYVKDLFETTIINHTDFDALIDKMTPNWEYDRIASIDLIIIKMAIIEFLKFPSIPTKVTINEYLEIAKDYSSEKSSYFINGVLDKLLKKYTADKKVNKIGRGLL
jgi:N utilization substance protein B